MNDILERVDAILRYADPNGLTYAKLKRLRQSIVENVFLSPADRKYLQVLQDKIDNIECEHFTRRGGCKVKKGPCVHRKRFCACSLYLQAKGGR
jgi:hypothetical protein